MGQASWSARRAKRACGAGRARGTPQGTWHGCVPSSQWRPPAQSPVFEVASVRPAQPGAEHPSIRRDPAGGFTASNLSPKALITMAYHSRISNSPLRKRGSRPNGMTSSPSAPSANKGDTRRMPQAVLADLFQLVIRRATKDLSIYELVVAKDGPKFRETRRAPV